MLVLLLPHVQASGPFQLRSLIGGQGWAPGSLGLNAVGQDRRLRTSMSMPAGSTCTALAAGQGSIRLGSGAAGSAAAPPVASSVWCQIFKDRTAVSDTWDI